MTSATATLTDQLADLRAELKAANKRRAAAKQAVKDEWKLNQALLAPLWDRRYKPQTLTPTFLRRFTDELLAQVKERGLVFDLSSAARSVTVIDPAAREELKEADEALLVAQQRLRAFESEHADALRAESNAAEAAGIREALAGDDPDAIRAALTGAAR